MGCGLKLVKYLMFFFNLLVFLSGAALLGIGIWILVDKDSFTTLISAESLIFNAVYIIIAVGGALFLIGFLGCCGAIKENRCLLGTFFTVVLVAFLLQIVGVVLAIVMRPQAEEKLKKDMKNPTNATLTTWREIQTQGKCCGLDDHRDWKNKYPDSCCKTKKKPCISSNVYRSGCKANMNKMFWILAGIALGILLIEILAMIFSCLLFHHVGKNSDY